MYVSVFKQHKKLYKNINIKKKEKREKKPYVKGVSSDLSAFSKRQTTALLPPVQLLALAQPTLVESLNNMFAKFWAALFPLKGLPLSLGL